MASDTEQVSDVQVTVWPVLTTGVRPALSPPSTPAGLRACGRPAGAQDSPGGPGLLLQFFRDADEEMAWVQEKLLLVAAQDCDQSLSALRRLQEKHQVWAW